jgi:hypothetical protein
MNNDANLCALFSDKAVLCAIKSEIYGDGGIHAVEKQFIPK